MSKQVTGKDEALKPVKNQPELHIQEFKDGRTRMRVQFDIHYKGTKGADYSDEPSKTEPDMTMTIQQLLERHSRGREIPMKQPLYFETEVPVFSDITDVARYKEQLEKRLRETKDFLDREKEELRAAKAAKAKQEQKEATKLELKQGETTEE